MRTVLPLKMWESAGFLPKTLKSISDVHKATWSTSVASQTFSFVAIDLPAAKPLEVGATVQTRFQANGEPGPPTNHKIYSGVGAAHGSGRCRPSGRPSMLLHTGRGHGVRPAFVPASSDETNFPPPSPSSLRVHARPSAATLA